MDISVYTSALETKIQQVLSLIYHTSKYDEKVSCECYMYPGNAMWCEFRIQGLKGRNEPSSYKWALDLYNRLRKFPCNGALKINFDYPKSHWSETHYGYAGYGYGVWTSLQDSSGLSVKIEARLEPPEQASDKVYVKFMWTFTAEGGEIDKFNPVPSHQV